MKPCCNDLRLTDVVQTFDVSRLHKICFTTSNARARTSICRRRHSFSALWSSVHMKPYCKDTRLTDVVQAFDVPRSHGIYISRNNAAAKITFYEVICENSPVFAPNATHFGHYGRRRVGNPNVTTCV
jgi:hypothetical protein